MLQLRSIWDYLRSSLWFVPSLMIFCAAALGLCLVEIDANLDRASLQERWPWLFGAGAAGTRGMLATIAGSMITIAGVAFSITIVALTQASTQYTSRILRNFMRDRVNQTVLGAFVGIFVYCLVVLRTIRGGDEGAFVPPLAVLVAVLLAFVGIACLIFFIHHIASGLQAETIIKAAADETIDAVDRLFPTEMGEEADAGQSAGADIDESRWQPVAASRTGYIQAVDGDALLKMARQRQTVIRMERAVGDFVIEGEPLVSIAADPPDKDFTATIDETFTIGHQRTTVQDTSFGVRQIVDVALKALSPGINDTTTAVTCVQYLSAILTRLAARRIDSRYRTDNGELRVIALGPTFEGMLADAFDQIRQNGTANIAVLLALLTALEVIAGRTEDAHRRSAVRQQVRLIGAAGRRSIPEPHDLQKVAAAVERLDKKLTDVRDPG